MIHDPLCPGRAENQPTSSPPFGFQPAQSLGLCQCALISSVRHDEHQDREARESSARIQGQFQGLEALAAEVENEITGNPDPHALPGLWLASEIIMRRLRDFEAPQQNM